MIARAIVVSLILAFAAAAQQEPAAETVAARRMKDIVAVRTQPDRTERILYYFNPTVELGVGDELEQGVGGHSVIVLADGGLITMFASGHVILRRLSKTEGDAFAFADLTLTEVVAGDRQITLRLPGDYICTLQQTGVKLTEEPGRIVVRNEGGLPVEIRGPFDLERSAELEDGLGRIVLNRGQEVELPLFDASIGATSAVRETWGGLALTHDGGFAVEVAGDGLVVERSRDPEAPDDDVLYIGGVRTVAGPSGRMIVNNRRRPAGTPLVGGSDGSAPVAEPRAPPVPRPVTTDPPPVQLSRQQIIDLLLQGQEAVLRAKGYPITEALLAEAERQRGLAVEAQGQGAAEEGDDQGPDPDDSGTSDDSGNDNDEENNEP